MPVCGQTCASAAALAVEEGPPSPAVKPGPIHGMGTAVRCRAYPVTGPASAKRNTDDEHSSTIARTFVGRPAQADEAESAREADHDEMRIMRQINGKVKRAHLFLSDGDVRTGAAGRVTPTFLSTLFTTTRTRSTCLWPPDHGEHLPPRTRVPLLVVAINPCGCSLSPETHVNCSERRATRRSIRQD